MIKGEISGKDALSFWYNLNNFAFTIAPEKCYCSGYIKRIPDVEGLVYRWGDFPYNWKDLGYTEKKFNQLKNIYYPSLQIGKLMSDMSKYKDRVVSLDLPMVGISEKEEIIPSTKGRCLLHMVFCVARGFTLEAHIFYRITETSRKFLADILFLDWVFSRNYGNDYHELKVRFHFVFVYSHIKQFPLIEVLFPGTLDSWEWEDMQRKEKIKKYMDGIRRGKFSKWGMIKGTEQLYWRKYGKSDIT